MTEWILTLSEWNNPWTLYKKSPLDVSELFNISTVKALRFPTIRAIWSMRP